MNIPARLIPQNTAPEVRLGTCGFDWTETTAGNRNIRNRRKMEGPIGYWLSTSNSDLLSGTSETHKAPCDIISGSACSSADSTLLNCLSSVNLLD